MSDPVSAKWSDANPDYLDLSDDELEALQWACALLVYRPRTYANLRRYMHRPACFDDWHWQIIETCGKPHRTLGGNLRAVKAAASRHPDADVYAGQIADWASLARAPASDRPVSGIVASLLRTAARARCAAQPSPRIVADTSFTISGSDFMAGLFGVSPPEPPTAA